MSHIGIEECIKSLERQIQSLPTQIRYCMANYTGNHPNNEKEIIKEKYAILKDANNEAKSFFDSYKRLTELLDKADELCEKVEQSLVDRGLQNQVDIVNEALRKNEHKEDH